MIGKKIEIITAKRALTISYQYASAMAEQLPTNDCVVKIGDTCIGLDKMRNVECDNIGCQFDIDGFTGQRFSVLQTTNPEKYRLLHGIATPCNMKQPKPKSGNFLMLNSGNTFINYRHIRRIECSENKCEIFTGEDNHRIFERKENMDKIRQFALDRSIE